MPFIPSPPSSSSSGLPAGSIVDFGGSSTPSGWLLCDGSNIANGQALYPDLYSAIGSVWGSDAGGTLTVPDLRGRVAVGRDNMGGSAANRITAAGSGITGTTLAATGGVETHTLAGVESGIAAHGHGIGTIAAGNESAHTHLESTVGSVTATVVGPSTFQNSPDGTFLAGHTTGAAAASPSTHTSGTGSSHTHTMSGSAANTTSTAAVNAHQNTQPTAIVNKIIKATN